MNNKISVPLLIFLLVLVCGAILQSHTQTLAQPDIQTFREKLDEFNSLTDFETPRLVLRLRSPIWGEDALILPQRITNEEGNPSHVITEIGQDYVCIDSTGGGIRTIDCIPFSNIVTITYYVP